MTGNGLKKLFDLEHTLLVYRILSGRRPRGQVVRHAWTSLSRATRPFQKLRGLDSVFKKSIYQFCFRHKLKSRKN